MNVASDHCAVIPQIESGLGVENLEEILQVEGIDALSMVSLNSDVLVLIFRSSGGACGFGNGLGQ